MTENEPFLPIGSLPQEWQEAAAPRLVTTIILAPSGAGKTTSIETLQKAGSGFMHIDRDQIVSRHWQKSGLFSSLKDLDNPAPVSAYFEQVKTICENELASAIAARTRHIVIDYPPSKQAHGWAAVAASLSKQAGRLVVAEGISANPEITLPRILQRYSNGLKIDSIPDVIADMQTGFHNWLIGYKNLTKQFLKIAAIADFARLHDNNGDKPILIAQQQGGQRRIVDEAACKQFSRLREINPTAARFNVDDVKSERKTHRFSISISGLFGPHEPASAAGSMKSWAHPMIMG